MKTVAFVEIDEYCQKVLRKHWKDVPIFSDIKTFGRKIFDEPVDLIYGGFPCQPFSVSGKRKGTGDNRYLWPEMFRVIQEYKPSWVVAENVRGILSIEQGMVFEQVCSDLEGEGYEVQPFVIPACAVNAPHRRERVWIIANLQRVGWETRTREGIQPQEQIAEGQASRDFDTEGEVGYPNITGSGIGLQPDRDGQEKNEERQGFPQPELSAANQTTANASSLNRRAGKGLEGWFKKGKRFFRQQNRNGGNKGSNWSENWYEVATRFCRVDDGVSNRVDRLKCLGNAVVPQIVEIIGRMIIRAYEG